MAITVQDFDCPGANEVGVFAIKAYRVYCIVIVAQTLLMRECAEGCEGMRKDARVRGKVRLRARRVVQAPGS